MKRVFLILTAMLLSTLPILAQTNQFVGDWITIDDKTGKALSVVHIFKATDGYYYGKITETLVGDGYVCTECNGADKDKPIVGLIIVRKCTLKNGELVGGKVLDPNNGKFYYGKIYLKDGKLVLRGSVDRAGIIGRSQVWIRKDD